VIAQEVEKVFPQLVSTDEQGRKQADYSGLIAPLIEAGKELDRVRTLEARYGQADEQTGQESQPEADRTIHRRTPSRAC
jgi:trimeric autotransporter adhesin